LRPALLARAVLLGLMLAALSACGPERTLSQAAAQARLAAAIAAAYDPAGHWPQEHFVRFDFVVRDGRDGEISRESILWDRQTGSCRYEVDAAAFANLPLLDKHTQTWQPLHLKLPAGRLVALVNRETRHGEAYIDGREQSRQVTTHVLERVEHCIFWLSMPLELPSDRYAVLEWVGPTQLPDGKRVNQASLAYPYGGNQTPGDVWWLFTSPDPTRVLRTQTVLQNTGQTLGADWTATRTLHDITFPTERRLDDGRRIVMENLDLPLAVGHEAFDQPRAVMPD
jgi:hypothetical protein